MSWLNWYWPVALAVVALIIFGVPETLAIKFGGETFSAFMAKTAMSGPWGRIWTMLWGLLIGALTVHFLGWCVSCTGG